MSDKNTKRVLDTSKSPSLETYVLVAMTHTRRLCDLLIADGLDKDALRELYIEMNELTLWYHPKGGTDYRGKQSR